MVFAALTRRCVAAFIDGCFLFAALLLVAIAGPPGGVRDGVGAVVVLVFFLVWFGLLPATRLQGTPGKRLLGIKVTDMNGEPIGILRCLLRFALWLLTLGTGGLGFLLAAWMPRRQALHDFGARTVVVQRQARPEEIAGAVAPPMWWFNRVLGVLFLLGFFTAIWANVNVYQDKRKRSKVVAAIYASAPFRKDVASAILEGKPMPAPPATLEPHTRSLSVRPDGKITLETDDPYPGGRVYFTPVRTAKGIEWKCTAENIKTYLGASCRE